MNDEVEVKRAARERLFDAVLADAVAAEAGGEGEGRSAHGGRFALAAAALLATLVTIGVALLQAGHGRDEAQVPEPFDALFPRVERAGHLDRLGLRIGTVEQARELPDGPLPPVKVLTTDPLGDGPISVEVLEALAGRSGVRSLVIGTHPGLPIDVWRGIAAMPDLEYVHIGCHVEAPALRELRHAPRLRHVAFGARQSRLGEDLVDALVELPHVDSVSIVWHEVPSAALERLAGLPRLHSLWLEGCELDDGWPDALGELRTLRWLFLSRGRWDDVRVSAEELHKLGKLAKLESLGLARAEIPAEGFAALPASLQVLKLHMAAPPAALRELLTRPRLRGIYLNAWQPGTEDVLCELLPKTKLERFGYHGPLSDRMWRGLQRLPRLRHLSFRTSGDLASCVDRVVELEHLEHLELYTSVPPAESLRPLRKLQHLERLVISRSGNDSAHAADLAALQQAVGADVDLIVR